MKLEIKKQQNKTSMTGNGELRRYSPDNPMSEIFLEEQNISIANEVVRISKELERTASQVALNWVRQRQQQQQHLPVIIPIIGARTFSQVKDNLGCLDFNLTSEQIQRLNDISKISLGFPYGERVYLWQNIFLDGQS